MNRFPLFTRTARLLICLLLPSATVHAVPPPGIMHHQGRIAVDGVNFDGTGYFKFYLGSPDDLFEWSNDGSSLGSDEPDTAVPVAVSNGHYAVPLGDTTFHANMNNPIPSAGFASKDEIYLHVWFSSSPTGPFEQLLPNRRLASVPYALSAGALSDPSFLGTTVDSPLDLIVNGERGLRIQPSDYDGPSLISGNAANSISTISRASVVLGGGSSTGGGNTISQSDYAALVGGKNNLLNLFSNSSGIYSGRGHSITRGSSSVIVGGRFNQLFHDVQAIVGSQNSSVGRFSEWSSIFGGHTQQIGELAQYSAIVGGRGNTVANNARYAFAAGRRAQAGHPGVFIWGDSTNADFGSTAANQFLIRASGGVGIGTNDPQSALHVAGTITADGFSGPLSGVGNVTSANVVDGSLTSADIEDGSLELSDLAPGVMPWQFNPAGMHYVGSNVGIGTTSPTELLELRGFNDPTLKIQSDGTDEISGCLSLRQSNNTGFDMYYDGRSAQDGLAFESFSGGASGGVPFYIDLDGKIGFGTTIPLSQMHLADEGSIRLILEADSDNTNESDHPTIELFQDGGVIQGKIGFFDSSNDLQIRTNDVNAGTNDLIFFPEGSAYVRSGTVDERVDVFVVQRPVFGSPGSYSAGFTITQRGDVSNYTDLELAGSTALKVGGGSWGVLSDARLKTNISDLHGSLDRLLELRSVSFDYLDPAMGLRGQSPQLGFIAQEVEAVFPQWVEAREDGMLSVSISGFEALTVDALRELRAEKDAQIAALAAENAALEERLARLEAIVEALKATE